MKYELRIMVFALIALFITHNSLFVIHPAYADSIPTPPPCVDKDSIKKGFGPCPAGLTEIEKTVGNIISVAVYLGFIAMLVLIVIAGFKYLTSGGEPKAIQSAHYTVTWALLGLAFFAIAWIILQLLQGFTGIPVTSFNIKSLCVGPMSTLQFCPTPPP